MLRRRKSASPSSLARWTSRGSSVAGVGGAPPSAVARSRRKTELVRLSAVDETRMPTLVAVSVYSLREHSSCLRLGYTGDALNYQDRVTFGAYVNYHARSLRVCGID